MFADSHEALQCKPLSCIPPQQGRNLTKIYGPIRDHPDRFDCAQDLFKISSLHLVLFFLKALGLTESKPLWPLPALSPHHHHPHTTHSPHLSSPHQVLFHPHLRPYPPMGHGEGIGLRERATRGKQLQTHNLVHLLVHEKQQIIVSICDAHNEHDRFKISNWFLVFGSHPFRLLAWA
jgi:hypothetical protein